MRVLVPLALLPVGAIVLTGYALRPAGPAIAPVRLALVRAGVLVGALTVASVEILSAAQALTRPAVAVLWAAGAALALVAAALRWRRDSRRRPAPLRRLADAWRAAGRLDRALAAVLIGLLAAELLIAVVSPPNNFDSMTYHLPKIEHWVVQHDVGFFATRIHRQDTFPPGAEYLLLQLRLLTGGSAGYNLVQWFAGLGCLLAASRIAGQLGGSPRAQLLSAVVLGTTPMVALEASSTQTDLVVAAWVGCLATLVLDELRRRSGPATVLLFGAVTGLIALTKTTGLLAAAPLLLLWGVAQLRLAQSAQLRTVLRRVARTALGSLVLLLAALALAGPYLHRSDQEFGSPLGPAYSRDSISMQRHDPAAVSVNALRIVQTLFDTPYRPLSRATAYGVERVAAGLRIGPNDPTITFTSGTFPFQAWPPDEDSVSYPVQAALVLLGAGFVAVRPGRRVPAPQRVAARGYAVAFWVSVLLYVGVVKWQPWGNRLILYALVMGAPLAGLWLDAVLRRAGRLPAAARTSAPEAIGTSRLATSPASTSTSHDQPAGEGTLHGAAVPSNRPATLRTMEREPPAPGSASAPPEKGPARPVAPWQRRLAAWAALLAVAVGATAGWLAVGYGWPRRLVGQGSVFTTHGTAAMFTRRERWRPDYEYIADALRTAGARHIGLAQEANTWEYPWWYLLPGSDIEALQSVLPGYPAAQPAAMDAVICAVPRDVCEFAYVPPGWTLTWHGSMGYALPPGR
jgi:hypothetical protein